MKINLNCLLRNKCLIRYRYNLYQDSRLSIGVKILGQDLSYRIKYKKQVKYIQNKIYFKIATKITGTITSI